MAVSLVVFSLIAVLRFFSLLGWRERLLSGGCLGASLLIHALDLYLAHQGVLAAS